MSPISPYRVTINGIDISGIIRTTEARAFGEHLRSVKLDLELVNDYDILQNIDLKGEVVLEVFSDDKYVRKFTGLVTEAESGQKVYSIKCSDYSQVLEETEVGGKFGGGLLPPEVIYYVAASIISDHISPETVHLNERQTLADFTAPDRQYIYIAPLPSCKVTDIVNMSGAYIYTADSTIDIDEFLINGDNFAESNPDWADRTTRIKFIVQADGFLQAFEKGYERLKSIVDMLSFSANFSQACFKDNDQYVFIPYNRQRALSDLSELPWAYVRDIDSSNINRYWIRWYSPHIYKRPLVLSSHGDPVLQLLPFLHKTWSDEYANDPNIHLLRRALHAIRLSRQASDVLDAVDYLWQCVEHIVSKDENYILFDKRSLQKLKDSISQSIDEMEYRAEQKAQIVQRINELCGIANQLSLLTKFSMKLKSLGIHLTDEEWNIVKQLRKQRNYYLHGRPATVKREMVNQFAGIIERVIIGLASVYK